MENEIIQMLRGKLTHDTVAQMIAHSVVGKETMTVLTEDWNAVNLYIEQLQENVGELERKTPVKNSYGLCTTIGCQWNTITQEREKWKKQEMYITTVNAITDDLVKLITSLVEAKVLPMEEWWSKTFAAINRRLEDLRRQ